MSAVSLPPHPTERQRKHAGITAVLIPWTVAAAIIAAYAAYGPRTVGDVIMAMIVVFGFIGMGCAILCAWLIRRDTITPLNDLDGKLNLIMTVIAQKHFADGVAFGRDSVPSVVINPRFGPPAARAQDNTRTAEAAEEPRGRTGTDPTA